MIDIQLWKVFASLGVPGLALGVFFVLFIQFKWKFPVVPRKWVGPLIGLYMLLSSGLIFYVFTLWAPTPGTAIVRVTVLGSDKMPLEDVQVWSSVGGEAKKVAGGWELEFPVGKLPRGKKVMVYAEKKEVFLKGQGEVVVDETKTAAVAIQLSRDTAAQVNGTVSDATGEPVPGVTVTVIGAVGSTTTDDHGFFSIFGNAAEGEEVRLRVAKSGYETLDQYHPAGGPPAYLILRKLP